MNGKDKVETFVKNHAKKIEKRKKKKLPKKEKQKKEKQNAL